MLLHHCYLLLPSHYYLLAVLMDILVVQESRRKKGFIYTKTVVFTADSVSRKMSHLEEQSLQNVC